MPRRPDETPTVDVLLNILAGLAAGLLLIALGDALRVIDDNLADLG